MAPQRTYSAKDWQAAEAAWREGAYGEEVWGEYRLLARQRGMLYPPAGGRYDSWDAEHPSQRALLRRAIDEDPELLRFAITGSRTWSEVLAVVLEERDGARAAAKQAEAEYRLERASYATQRQAAASLADIMQTIADSVGTKVPCGDQDVVQLRHEMAERWRQWHHTEHAGTAIAHCHNDACHAIRFVLEGGKPIE